jgi:hypothetical protein
MTVWNIEPSVGGMSVREESVHRVVKEFQASASRRPTSTAARTRQRRWGECDEIGPKIFVTAAPIGIP